MSHYTITVLHTGVFNVMHESLSWLIAFTCALFEKDLQQEQNSAGTNDSFEQTGLLRVKVFSIVIHFSKPIQNTDLMSKADCSDGSFNDS